MLVPANNGVTLLVIQAFSIEMEGFPVDGRTFNKKTGHALAVELIAIGVISSGSSILKTNYQMFDQSDISSNSLLNVMP